MWVDLINLFIRMYKQLLNSDSGSLGGIQTPPHKCPEKHNVISN